MSTAAGSSQSRPGMRLDARRGAENAKQTRVRRVREHRRESGDRENGAVDVI